ncbi:hypothetical protein MAPG_11119 [Magnaporthiopsis poae ATCC 64411]|uniref:Uncharacterized protein n=1 Tax=Magnaporthiopsis poae (strain ATCC 64411 / 73-15) TaxID=644358 RepID=A0A0C4EEE6_MAGP6|nr:hypothetical protein MAPG_11119 [Magnaporthiopsis poae ATCC 64411]
MGSGGLRSAIPEQAPIACVSPATQCWASEKERELRPAGCGMALRHSLTLRNESPLLITSAGRPWPCVFHLLTSSRPNTNQRDSAQPMSPPKAYSNPHIIANKPINRILLVAQARPQAASIPTTWPWT